MSASRIQVISKGRRVPFLAGGGSSTDERPWAGFFLEESNTKMEAVSHAFFPKTTIFLCTGGQGAAHWKHRGDWNAHRVGPGSLFIVRRDTEIQAAWATNAWSRIVLQLDNARLQHDAPNEVSAVEKTLISALTTKDKRVAALMLAMRDEISAGCASGRLFAESISLALLAYLAGRYATPRRADNHAGLSSAQMRGIVDHIRGNVTSDITVMELAGLVQMSPSHFSRVFRASFGVSPYRFVMQERIGSAKNMLTTTKLSSSQVAMAFGFASQNHFVKVFRQFTGVTPKQFKAGP